jgi:hypothetical protein
LLCCRTERIGSFALANVRSRSSAANAPNAASSFGAVGASPPGCPSFTCEKSERAEEEGNIGSATRHRSRVRAFARARARRGKRDDDVRGGRVRVEGSHPRGMRRQGGGAP